MDDEQDFRRTWSHQFQGTSYGDAVDRAIAYWRKIIYANAGDYRNPDEVVAVGPFSPQMRPDRVNRLDNMNGVWDITIRWY
jgi:hypothetical protein